MNQDRIDKIGVSAAVTYFCRGGYINPHISFDDKIAVWDGSLEVHKSKDSTCSKDIDFDIKVQVKSSERDSNNFPPADKQMIKISDLNHYKENGGTLLIKVLVGRNKSQLYFAYLGKLKLNRLLENCKTEQDEKTIDVHKAPKDIKEVVRSLRSMHLQGKHNLMSFAQLANRTDFTISTTIGPIPQSENPYIWMATHYVDLLVNLPGFDEPFYLKEGPSLIMTRHRVDKPVSINDRTYFDSFEIETGKNGFNLYISDFFVLNEINQEKTKKGATVSVTPNSSSLIKYIDEIEFALGLIEHKSFSLDNYVFNCPELTIPENKINLLHSNLTYAKSIVELFHSFGLEPDFDRNLLSKQEHESLELLINYYLTNKALPEGKFKQQIYTFSIGNYKLGFAVHENNEELRLVDINKCKVFRKRNSDNKLQEFPIFTYCIHNELFIDNLDYPNFIKIYDSLYSETAEDYLENVNLDGLALLKIYDKTSNDFYLKKAQDLFNWLISKAKLREASDNVYFINAIQCKYRSSEVISDEEINQLKSISNNPELSLAVYALLNDVENVKRIWYNYDESCKKTIQEFPIYTIIKKVIA